MCLEKVCLLPYLGSGEKLQPTILTVTFVTWQQREHQIPGKHNIIHKALVPRDNNLLPPLHIKLGLVKQFVKALEPNSVAYLHTKYKTCFLIYQMQK